MDISVTRIARILLPRLPYIFALYILNKLSLSTGSDKQDATVETVVYIIRSLLTSKRPLSYIQRIALKDPGVKGKVWIAKVTAAAPETSVRDAVVQGIKILGDGTEQYILPDVTDVEAEWTGCRHEAGFFTQQPEGSEQQHYNDMMKEVTSPVTILYFHGGAYFMMDPITHRNTTSQLAKRTRGRCLSVRYRLAPQNPFPAALVDALTAYLYLLSPPAGALHHPIAANNIVFAGDSAGGNLAAVLGLLLLTLHKDGVRHIRFHGKDVPLELPAGLALNSPWCDIGRSLPSVVENAKYDYLSLPSATGLSEDAFPKDDIWPASPPRAEIFCQASLLTHPLVSPVAAGSNAWEGCPPVFICGGREGLQDEFTVMARRMFTAGVTVDFVGYEGMPHCFSMIFTSTPIGKDCWDRWAGFCTKAVNREVTRTPNGLWSTVFSHPLSFEEIKLADMGLADVDADQRLARGKSIAMEREAEAVRQWEADSRAKL